MEFGDALKIKVQKNLLKILKVILKNFFISMILLTKLINLERL